MVKKILMLLRSSHIRLDPTGKFYLVELHTTVLKVRSLMRYHKKVKCIKQASPTCLHTALGKARPASLLAQLYELKQGD